MIRYLAGTVKSGIKIRNSGLKEEDAPVGYTDADLTG